MSNEIEDFARAVRTYIKVVESAKSKPLLEFLKDVQRCLAEIQFRFLLLPDGLPGEVEADGVDAAPLRKELEALFGAHDSYQQIFYPYEDTEPVTGSLADDLADIYGELKDILDMPLATPEEKAYDWKSLYFHWGGCHLLSAQYAIYYLLERLEERQDDA